MNICLIPMTKELCRIYHQAYANDPMLFMDMRRFQPYIYSTEGSDAFFDRQAQLGRIHLAVMLEDEPIGDIILKEIDPAAKCCTLSICMKNDHFKNKGYGTRAELLALDHAFTKLGMETVYTDAVQKNTRSQHVLEKAGFQETHSDNNFRYYRCDRAAWNRPSFLDSM